MANGIAYDSAGSGPLVVGLPGLGDVRQQYRFLAAQLVEAGYRVVTMDIRGQGESSVGWPAYSVAGVGSDILALIQDLHDRLGATALIVTHDRAVAQSCSRTLVLTDGRIVGDQSRGDESR